MAHRPAPLAIASPVVVTLASATVLVGSFLPWLRSGRRPRTSYEMYGLLRRLDVVDGTFGRLAVGAWPLMPVVVVAAALAGWYGRRALGAGLAFVGGTYVVVVCMVAWRAPLRPLTGVVVSLVGGLALMCGAALLLRRGGTAE